MFEEGKNDSFDHLGNKVERTPEDLVDNECSDNNKDKLGLQLGQAQGKFNSDCDHPNFPIVPNRY